MNSILKIYFILYVLQQHFISCFKTNKRKPFKTIINQLNNSILLSFLE